MGIGFSIRFGMIRDSLTHTGGFFQEIWETNLFFTVLSVLGVASKSGLLCSGVLPNE